MLDKRILTPMRFAVQGTLDAARCALKNKEICWNLGGGYHHACPQSMEGFCIYNDIGIAYQEMIASGELSPEDKILIIDTDAHHGNGNAMTFHENTNVTILDVYNEVIYPQSRYTRERVDIPVLLVNGTQGEQYLSRYAKALEQLTSEFKLAFVVAGTDVLISDKLGRLCLTQDDVVEREILTFDALRQRGIPAVFLGGGGYSQESAPTITASIKAVNARLSGKHESTLDATLLASPI